MVGRDDDRPVGNALGALAAELEVEAEEGLREGDEDAPRDPRLGQLELRMLAEDLLPVDFLDLHPGLALGHVVRHVGHALEGRQLVGGDIEAEAGVDEDLQAHLVEGVEGEVELDVVSRADFANLLALDVSLDYFILVAHGLVEDLGLCGRRRGVDEELLELETLNLVELGARQVVVADLEVENLLISRGVGVILVADLPLDLLLYLVVRKVGGEGLGRDDDCHEGVVLLSDGGLLDDILPLLELLLYLRRVDVLAVREDYYLLAAASDYHAPLGVDVAEVASVYPPVAHHLRGLIGSAIVALHNVVAASHELAVAHLDVAPWHWLA